MNLLDAALPLKKMEHILKKELQSDKKDNRIIGDMGLSYEDYKCLALKMKGMQQYSYRLDMLDDYKLSMIITWVFALKYERDTRIAYESIKDAMKGQPQYFIRKFLEICDTAFKEYKINTYDVEIQSMVQLMSLITIHAGIPKQMMPAFFAILEDSLHYSDMTVLEQRFNNNMSAHMRELYQYVEDEMQKALFYNAREMFIDCKVNGLTKEKLLRKYNTSSRLMIESCIRWVESEKASSKKEMG